MTFSNGGLIMKDLKMKSMLRKKKKSMTTKKCEHSFIKNVKNSVKNINIQLTLNINRKISG